MVLSGGVFTRGITPNLKGKHRHVSDKVEDCGTKLFHIFSGIARVAELRGQAGGKGLCQEGEHIHEPEGPALCRQEVSWLLKAPSN